MFSRIRLFQKKMTTHVAKTSRYLGMSSVDAEYVVKLGMVVLGIALIMGLGFAGEYVYRLRKERAGSAVVDLASVRNVADTTTAPCFFRRHLDGVCVVTAEDATPPITAIMVENSRDAWPLSGIARANVVYEAPAESNIPRFMALYAEDTLVEKVGPVRSARPYYIDWAKEYADVMYMHVGGSPEALDRIAADDSFLHMNEMTRGWYFWRSDDRFAPHNTYTSTRLWQKARADYGDESTSHDISTWTFETTTPAGGACAQECVSTIRVSYGASWYDVTWKYNSSTDQYERWQNGSVDRDEDGTPRVADTVIVQHVRATILDDIGRKKITTVGTGDAAVFRHGQIIAGTWNKPRVTERTVWLDEAKEPIALKPGKIWIEVVPQNASAEWE